jgi:signal transduction histidine kinase
MRNLSKILIAVLLLFGTALRLPAQHNPYKIEDSLYDYFMRMVKLKTDPVCLQMVDTLYSRAFALGDRKAECLAYTIPLNYYFIQPKSYEQMHMAAENLRHISRENGYMRYYFYATSNEITYLLNEGRTGQAIRLALQFRNEAFASGDNNGIYSCLLALGNVYLVRHEYPKALDHYMQAYNHLATYLPDQDDTQVLSRIANCYSCMHDSETALRYARQALETAKTETGLLRALEEDLAFFYKYGQTWEFLHYYAIAKDVMTRVGYRYRDGWFQVEAYKSLYDGDYKQAHVYADLAGGSYERDELHSEIYLAQKDFKRAYECIKKANEVNEVRLIQQQNEDLEEMEAQERREQLADQLRELDLKQERIEATRHQWRMNTLLVGMALLIVVMVVITVLRHRHVRMLDQKNHELEAARAVAEAARELAVKERMVAEDAQKVAEDAQKKAEDAQKKAEDAQKKAETLQKVAEDARDKAELADRMKTMFVQNMSHEIRTPLNAIVGFSSILTDSSFDLAPEERKDIADRIAQSSDMLTTLVNDILDLSNLESGKYMMDLKPINPNTICSFAMDSVRYRLPKDVELKFDTDVSDELLVTTDGMRVQQVLINFLTNAEKNTEQGEISLHCSAKEHPGYITYSVEDTGIGVPPDKAESIFERFTKLDEFKQGSGLGLSICSVISDRLGGHVFLDTKYTGGARFVFEVPMSA